VKISPNPNIVPKLYKTPLKPFSRNKIASYLGMEFENVAVVVRFTYQVVFQ
jgi:hypothetical protein